MVTVTALLFQVTSPALLAYLTPANHVIAELLTRELWKQLCV